MSFRSSTNKLLKRFEKSAKTFNLIKISRSAILNNYQIFQKLCPHAQIWPILKSNAYGHGLIPMTHILKDISADYFVVDSYLEALEIWKVNPRPVLLVGDTHPQNFSYLNFKNLTLTIQNLYSLRLLAQTKKTVKIHLKVNTGMHRQGINIDQIPQFIKILKKHHRLKFEGLWSHLSDTDSTDNSYTRKQQKLFQIALEQIKQAGFSPKYTHLCATAGATKIKKHYTVIRLGIGLYGYNPLSEKDPAFKKLVDLLPALSLTSTITNIRTLQKGDQVSYNRTFTAKNNLQLVTIPFGYFEGLDHRLSNRGFIKYRHHFYPIAGRVCMNLTSINFKNTLPRLYHPVNIISPNPDDKNSIKNIARLTHTIPYQILVHLHPSIRRKIIP